MIAIATPARLTPEARDNAAKALANLDGLIHELVWRHTRGLDVHTREDLLQDARVHLIVRVLPAFDPTLGVKLSTFAYRCIQNHLLTAIASREHRPALVRLRDVAEPLAPDRLHDRAVEALADDIQREAYRVPGAYAPEVIKAGADLDLLARQLGNRTLAIRHRHLTVQRIKKIVAQKIAA